jgi:hypothetical protein
MTFRNDLTGDLMQLPPPDRLGCSCVKFNGVEVETILFSDVVGSVPVTLGDGMQFRTTDEFVNYLLERLKSGHYRDVRKNPEVDS